MTARQENSLFALYNRKEIVFVLEDLAKHHTAINLDTADGAGLVTNLLEVGFVDDYLYLDISPDAQINQRILDSKQIKFSSQTGVKVRWQASNLQLVTLADGDAFAMAIPASIERIQRREYFRMSAYLGGKALICKIPLEANIIEATIADISVGGIGILLIGSPHAIFSEGEVLEGCSIEFPSIGPVPLRLKVCGVWTSSQTKSGEPMYHVGFEFKDMNRSVENAIQRHMLQLERDRLSLK
jgi:c-di-GMP-binding flagellar brake protein YcgR